MFDTYTLGIIFVVILLCFSGLYIYNSAETPITGAALTPSGNVLTNTTVLSNGTVLDSYGVPIPGATPLLDATMTKSGKVYSNGTLVPNATVVATTPAVSVNAQPVAATTSPQVSSTTPVVSATGPTVLPSGNAGSSSSSTLSPVSQPAQPAQQSNNTTVAPIAPTKTTLANAVKFNSSFGAATGKTLVTQGIASVGGATAYKTEQGVDLIGVQPLTSISVDSNGVVYQGTAEMTNTVYIPSANLALAANQSTAIATLATNSGMGGTVKNIKIGTYPDISTVGIPQKSLSSVTLPDGLSAVFYAGAGLTGQSYTCIGPAFINNFQDFSFNDMVISLTVEPSIPSSLEPAPCTLYATKNLAGSYTQVDYSTINDINLICFGRSKLNAIKVANNVTVTLYSSTNLTGTSLTIKGPQTIPDLSVSPFKFNGKAQSLTVKPT